MATISPLVVVVGETASGKTALGVELAKKYNGEIICADSRTVYKGMDIGTAKPTVEERAGIPHHLIDVVEPDEKYQVVMFQRDANQAIADIYSRGKLPIMVGGTGLYVDSVIFDYDFDAKTMKSLREHTLVIGVRRDKDDLKQRIEQRVEQMIEDGFVDEVRALGEQYGWDAEAMTGIGYRAFADYIKGEKTLEQAKKDFVRGDALLAKRQRTWFRRPVYENSIQWVGSQEEALSITGGFLYIIAHKS